MGLLSIIRKIKRKEKEMRILMVGLDNSGKTTIVLKINGEDTSVISPTLGFNIKTIKYHKYSLNIWDVGGQKTIRSYWRNYFEQTDGLVWVVDSSDIRRLDDCRAELHNLLKEERLAGASLLVFANKQDIQGALKPAEIAKAVVSIHRVMVWRVRTEMVLQMGSESGSDEQQQALEDCGLQRLHWRGASRGLRLAGPGRRFSDLRPGLIFVASMH
ncbi:ADP-ribosylation factor-like protein 2 isoform X1 [Sorghum bicolor]|uniref:ADP-ribosylation factor-like protein 2 isoform X1 n=1 Tax=Sorghum bicolor TaxID=4558 RepID=UPI000B42674B|nr:ADP-ribosylation factor-like protein 2 isoform X1 [Sorghum bicolor]|eukprot:XP_021317496.1 ADP-ribosylation factor-like protein 2 isoform X1 [Sorghum bicolor]